MSFDVILLNLVFSFLVALSICHDWLALSRTSSSAIIILFRDYTSKLVHISDAFPK